MNKRLALFVAVIMGLMAVFLIHVYIKNIQRNATKGMEEVTVLVAAEDMEKGAILTDKRVAYRLMPRNTWPTARSNPTPPARPWARS